jgi:hypothetical protein
VCGGLTSWKLTDEGYRREHFHPNAMRGEQL